MNECNNLMFEADYPMANRTVNRVAHEGVDPFWQAGIAFDNQGAVREERGKHTRPLVEQYLPVAQSEYACRRTTIVVLSGYFPKQPQEPVPVGTERHLDRVHSILN